MDGRKGHDIPRTIPRRHNMKKKRIPKTKKVLLMVKKIMRSTKWP
jgi:hypothetical protein